MSVREACRRRKHALERTRQICRACVGLTARGRRRDAAAEEEHEDQAGEARGYQTRSLMLAPHTTSGYNVCPRAGACWEVCLGGTGCNHVDAAMDLHVANTQMLFEDGEGFVEMLHAE